MRKEFLSKIEVKSHEEKIDLGTPPRGQNWGLNKELYPCPVWGYLATLAWGISESLWTNDCYVPPILLLCEWEYLF